MLSSIRSNVTAVEWLELLGIVILFLSRQPDDKNVENFVGMDKLGGVFGIYQSSLAVVWLLPTLNYPHDDVLGPVCQKMTMAFSLKLCE